MIRKNFTPTPNILFDKLLKELSSSELKILLVIIRQTNGWIDKKTGKRKERDRITYSQFINKTGLSRRVISEAVDSLSQKKLIQITDASGNILNLPIERKGQYYIYYSSLLNPEQSVHMLNNTSAINDTNMCKNQHQHVQNMVYNKRNYNKIERINKTEKDYVHIKEILDKIKFKWNP